MGHLLKNTFSISIAFIICFFISSCTVHEPKPVLLEELEEIHPKELLAKETFYKPPEPPPFTEKMAPVTKGLTEDTRLYSLVFENAPLGEIINAILADIDYNLSVESGIDLTKPVTVRITNATLSEALEMVIAKGSDYAWKIDDGFVYVKRYEEKIYHLDYLDMSSETDIDIGGDMLASSVENAGVVGKFQVKAKRTTKTNDVWTNVKEALEALKSPQGILRLNRNAGIIYMADTPLRIDTMVNFLDSLAESLHRQVFIEARIMEVKLNDDHKYGIDWTDIDILFTSDFGILPDNFDLFLNDGSTVALADTSSISAVVDFLRTQGEVSVLSNPHLAVMNGQSAVFTVGFQFPFGDIEGVDENFETNTVTFRSTIKRAILGLQLGLTPQISREGIISLLIVPTITRIKEEVDVELPTTRGGSQTISNPVIDLQELATTVRVRERQSVVLAGLISQIKKLEHEGLPLLNKLPILKYLFGRIEESYENSELVIFLTPYIKTVN
jgi:type II secretory pathway component GspD/PulD (secretin)